MLSTREKGRHFYNYICYSMKSCVLKQGKPNGISIYSNSMGSDCKGMRGCTHRHTQKLFYIKQPCCLPLNDWSNPASAPVKNEFYYSSLPIVPLLMLSYSGGQVWPWAFNLCMFKLAVCFGSVLIVVPSDWLLGIGCPKGSSHSAAQIGLSSQLPSPRPLSSLI